MGSQQVAAQTDNTRTQTQTVSVNFQGPQRTNADSIRQTMNAHDNSNVVEYLADASVQRQSSSPGQVSAPNLQVPRPRGPSAGASKLNKTDTVNASGHLDMSFKGDQTITSAGKDLVNAAYGVTQDQA